MKELKNEYLTIMIKPQGAELTSINGAGHEYLWQADPQFWPRHAPVLFPIVGRLTDDQYTYDGHRYQLSQHGFARDCEFVLTKESENSVTYTLVDNEQTREKYPFKFQLDITYTLNLNELVISYCVTNNDHKMMYYAIGAHPAFNINALDRYTLQIPGTYNEFVLTDGFISGKISDQRGNKQCSTDFFAPGAYIYQPHDQNDKVITLLDNGQPYIQMEYPDFKIMGVWTPERRDAPFICLEPWNGIADFTNRDNDDLIAKDYIESLAAGACASTIYKIKFYKEKENE